MIKYDKKYNTKKEYKKRLSIFESNLGKIESWNSDGSHGEATFAPSKFSDLDNDEIASHFQNEPSLDIPIPDKSYGILPYLPESINWTQQGAVSPVGNVADDCSGTSWAFAAAGTLEGSLFLYSDKLTPLSEQNLIDCTPNVSCFSGSVRAALIYTIENGGIDTESSYPYVGEPGRCNYQSQNSGCEVKNCTDVIPGSEADLMQQVANNGPIAATMTIDDSFTNYEKGVFESNECSQTTLKHSVLVVGYGTTANGTDYWIVKNCWGSDWGQLYGYFLLARNKDNMCNIASWAIYCKVRPP